MVLYVVCTDCENDKIRLTSYSSFVNVSYVMCTDYECREVDEVRERRGLDEEENVTDMKERETNEERQTRLVNLCRCLHILVMALHIDWLGEERMIEIDVQSSVKGQERECLQSPLILLYSVVAIVIIYNITLFVHAAVV